MTTTNADLAKQFQEQLKRILDEYENLRSNSKYEDISDTGLKVAHRLISLSRAAIERISGINSSYSKQFQVALNAQNTYDHQKLFMIIGIVEALYSDLQAGYLSSITDILHGEIFADFLEMADYLSKEGFKDAAAVICGGALESHLRQLCLKNGIQIEISTSNGIRPKKVDALNSELASMGIYSKLYQKSVTAWLDLRNKAAHALYTEYSKDQVDLMISGVRNFILDNQA